MGTTIWVLQQSTAADHVGDSMDHSLIYSYADQLDRLAVESGVEPLSNFFDDADLRFTLSEDDLPESWLESHQRWFDPVAALPSLRTLATYLKAHSVPALSERIRLGLIEELDDCISKVELAIQENDKFQFCLIE